jgi:hypothetical protein
MKPKEFEDWTFDELVEQMTWFVIESIIGGKQTLKSAMFAALNTALGWYDKQREKKGK